jgi:Fe-S-cluster containining protein
MRKPSRELISQQEAIDAVKAVYAELENRPVERDCVRRTECCQFKLTGKTPYLTAGESLVTATALQQSGVHKLPAKQDGSCPLLKTETGRCIAYEDRPFSCRTHFCAAAGGPYSRKEVQDLIWRLEDLDTRLGGVGAQTLPAALKEALPKVMFHKGDSSSRVHSKAAPRARGRG